MSRSATHPDRPAPRALGSIRADEVLPAELYRNRMGISQKGWRELLRRGFPCVSSGKRQYVIGEHAIAYFKSLAEGGQQ
jgi:hypothetical protein